MPLPQTSFEHSAALLLLLLAAWLACTQPAQAAVGLSEGCIYKVHPGDTLHKISRSLNIQMDAIQEKNTADLTDPSNVKPGHMINIPCPGSSYQQYTPLNIAGCFFDYVIESTHPSILSLVRHPPDSIPGPFSITGIWTANYQALPQYSIDLTAPGQYYVGRRIYLPTCGHSGELIDTTPVSPNVSCYLDFTRISTHRPSSLKEVSAALNVSVSTLTQMQGNSSLPAQLGPSTVLAIPCPA